MFFLSSSVYFGFPHRPQFFPLAPRKLRTDFVTTFSSFAKLAVSLHALDPSFVFSSCLVLFSVGCFHLFKNYFVCLFI